MMLIDVVGFVLYVFNVFFFSFSLSAGCMVVFEKHKDNVLYYLIPIIPLTISLVVSMISVCFYNYMVSILG